MPITACKKKLYALNPANPPQFVQTQRTRKKQREVPADPKSLERQIRQMLADKISGNQIGIWLLLPEHLRLGTWDLMRSWSGLPPDRVEPRLALHLVNEAAMCLCSYRQRRTLSQKGFELANGLPFVPTDMAIHNLLASHTVQEAQQLQMALGKLRRAGGHFEGTLLALDPHRMTSYSKRQMRRHRFHSEAKPAKMAQTFFLLDCHTGQPVCFSLTSSAQALGWHRAGTLNLNIRYGHLTMVLVAQAAIHQLRQRLGAPCAQWDATHLARNLFEGLEGDVRVEDKTIVVTLYNPPNAPLLRHHYERLPEKLAQEGVNPEIPWLYNFRIDFRFK